MRFINFWKNWYDFFGTWGIVRQVIILIGLGCSITAIILVVIGG